MGLMFSAPMLPEASQDGQKSANLREAQVLELNVMPSNGARSPEHSSGSGFQDLQQVACRPREMFLIVSMRHVPSSCLFTLSSEVRRPGCIAQGNSRTFLDQGSCNFQLHGAG